MITRIIKVQIEEKQVANFKEYMKEFIYNALAFNNNQHADFFLDKETDNQFHIYTIWKTNGALSKFRNSEINLGFRHKLSELSKEPYSAWTVENLF